MKGRIATIVFIAGIILCPRAQIAAEKRPLAPKFQTSDRCVACHNSMTTAAGQDLSIGIEWRSSMMANSSRDPYWQGSVRRETMEHPESKSAIEDECSVCHMPIPRYLSKSRGREGQLFSFLPFDPRKEAGRQAQDGVTCSICHQIGKQKLGTPESFNGGFVIDLPANKDEHLEYGPFEIDKGHRRIMRTATGGFVPTEQPHIRQSEVCATCHTLYTKALGPGGKVVGEIPEQVPYQEWLHSDFKDKQSCQSCHMPAIEGETPITRVLGIPRKGAAHHSFVGANFFMQRLLNRYRADLDVGAQPQELSAAAERTVAFLQAESARVRIEHVEANGGRLDADVFVENRSGHKLPTAYPSRRAWLHVVVRDRDRHTVFESGASKPDGAIEGNDNDEDAARFEPHYTRITGAGQVQIYESVMGDPADRVTTGLLTGVRYLKDNRLLPRGFDKRTAHKDIAVIGAANTDPDFTDRGDRVRYSVALGGAQGPFEMEVELWYQPIGYRWAHNLKAFDAEEPRRFTTYYDSMASSAGVMIARAHAVKFP